MLLVIKLLHARYITTASVTPAVRLSQGMVRRGAGLLDNALTFNMGGCC
jgi:hypothetical protein